MNFQINHPGAFPLPILSNNRNEERGLTPLPLESDLLLKRIAQGGHSGQFLADAFISAYRTDKPFPHSLGELTQLDPEGFRLFHEILHIRHISGWNDDALYQIEQQIEAMLRRCAMSIIKTDLRTAATDEKATLTYQETRHFPSVFKLGLILGSKDPHSKQFPTDEKGLQDMKSSLESMIFNCLTGLAGIGAIIGAANPAALIKDDLGNIGSAIRNMSLLGMEAQDYIESIDIDLRRRNGYLTDREQFNIHAELHMEALAVQELDGGDYENAIISAARCLQASKQVPVRAKK